MQGCWSGSPPLSSLCSAAAAASTRAATAVFAGPLLPERLSGYVPVGVPRCVCGRAGAACQPPHPSADVTRRRASRLSRMENKRVHVQDDSRPELSCYWSARVGSVETDESPKPTLHVFIHVVYCYLPRLSLAQRLAVSTGLLSFSQEFWRNQLGFLPLQPDCN